MPKLTRPEQATAHFFRSGLEQLFAKTLGVDYEVISLTPGVPDTQVSGLVRVQGPAGPRELAVRGGVSHEGTSSVRVAVDGLGEGLFEYTGIGPLQKLIRELYHTDLRTSGWYAEAGEGRYVSRDRFVQAAQERLVRPEVSPSSAVEKLPALGEIDEAPAASPSAEAAEPAVEI